LKKKDIDSLQLQDIDLTINSESNEEEIDSWKEVFGIEERYKEKCLSKNYGKFWYQEATDEYENLPEEVKTIYPKAQWVDKLIRSANTNKNAQANFIKAAFLKACKVSELV
jgi:hypothetical protein